MGCSCLNKVNNPMIDFQLVDDLDDIHYVRKKRGYYNSLVSNRVIRHADDQIDKCNFERFL